MAVPPGVGLGWRPEISGLFDELPGLRFCEVIAESLSGRGPTPEPLADLVARGVTVVPHGVRLSLGGAEPVDPGRVAFLAGCVEQVGAPLVSEHIAFVRAGGVDVGHLLPVPRTRETLDVLVRNVTAAQAALPVPLALEPIAALFDWPDNDIAEPDFLNRLLDRTGALLLLDVANVYANARNRGQDPAALLQRLPLERIAYVHVAGGAEHDGLYHDTHTDPTPPEVLDLVRWLAEERGGTPFLLERDGDYPPKAQLYAELDAIADAAGQPRVTGQAAAAVDG
ncbi:MAG: DUF692 domain-containing protein [Micromonosporaceae bacterium]